MRRYADAFVHSQSNMCVLYIVSIATEKILLKLLFYFMIP